MGYKNEDSVMIGIGEDKMSAGMREVIRIQVLPTAAYIEAFTHIRERVCIPRDMSQQAATEFKALLDYLINALA